MSLGRIFMIAILLGGAFAGQLALCLKANTVMSRLWPVIILTGLEIICGIIVVAVGDKTEVGTVVSMFALSQMVIVGGLLVPVDLAWLVYGVIWLIQKLKNKSEVYGENT